MAKEGGKHCLYLRDLYLFTTIMRENLLYAQLRRLSNLDYPFSPNATTLAVRRRRKFDYRGLFDDDIIPINPWSATRVIHGIEIKNRICSYHGQVDRMKKKPQGVGVAVDEDGGDIFEGCFANGQIKRPYMYFNSFGNSFAYFALADGQ